MKFHLSAIGLLLFATTTTSADPTGWRGDGSGRYPHALPPTTWGPDTNLVWVTPIDAWSNSTPAVTEHRVFVTGEPDTLLCIDSADGQLLWSATNSFQDLTDENEIRKIAEAKALQARLNEQRDVLATLEETLQDAAGATAEDDHPESTAQRNALAQTVATLETELEAMAPYLKAGTNPNTGYASATPVTDGSYIWVLFGHGVTACYDLAGQRRWIRLTEPPVRPDFGHSSSPLLVDDLLIIHMNDLIALDAHTGKLRWRTVTPALPGTAVVAEIAGTKVILTPGGTFVRARDGAVLASMGEQEGWIDIFNSPIVHGSMAWFGCSMNGDAVAVGLPKKAEPFEPKIRWKQRIDEGSHYYGSPLVNDGLLYVVNEPGHLRVLDTATGAVRFHQELGIGITFPSLTLAGEHLFVSGQGGTTVVFAPGSTPREIGRNKIEKFRSCPVFHGERLYLRTYKNLYCFGREQP